MHLTCVSEDGARCCSRSTLESQWLKTLGVYFCNLMGINMQTYVVLKKATDELE